MEQYIPTIAALFVFTLIQCLVLVFTLDKMISVKMPYSGTRRYTPKMRKPNSTGDWMWIPFDNKTNTIVRNPATTGIPQWNTEAECLAFCEQLERTGGLV